MKKNKLEKTASNLFLDTKNGFGENTKSIIKTHNEFSKLSQANQTTTEFCKKPLAPKNSKYTSQKVTATNMKKFNLDTSALCLDDDRNRVFERIYDKKIFTPKHNKPIIFDVENNPIHNKLIVSNFQENPNEQKQKGQPKLEPNNYHTLLDKKAEIKENRIKSDKEIVRKTDHPKPVSKLERRSSKQSERAAIIAGLTDDEKNLYGDRILENYEKKELLGKGGFALVWLGLDQLNENRKVAIKQIAKQNSETCKNELLFGDTFFDNNGDVREEFKLEEGIKYITHLLHHQQTSKDLWLIYELGGSTLSKLLSEMKGEFYKGERVYSIKQTPLHTSFQTDYSYLRVFIKSITHSLDLLSSYKIIHCDLKPDNILLSSSSFPPVPKIIDFGSSFSLFQTGSLSMATPEYMPPEILIILSDVLKINDWGLCHKKIELKNDYQKNELQKKTDNIKKTQIEILSDLIEPWSVDIWSLGAIILEILIGVPLWLSYKCKTIDKKGRENLKMGIFAVKGRSHLKIVEKQKKWVEEWESKISELIDLETEDGRMLGDLVGRMMEWEPRRRISPRDVLEHPFLRN